MDIISVSIAISDKLNCATKLNASNVVMLPPPLHEGMANRPLCFCSCYVYNNIEGINIKGKMDQVFDYRKGVQLGYILLYYSQRYRSNFTIRDGWRTQK